MADSEHSQVRMRQRGISPKNVELIIENGTLVPVAGGADLCRLPRRQIHEEICQLKRQIRQLESLKDVAVVMAANGDLITVEHHIRRRRVRR